GARRTRRGGAAQRGAVTPAGHVGRADAARRALRVRGALVADRRLCAAALAEAGRADLARGADGAVLAAAATAGDVGARNASSAQAPAVASAAARASSVVVFLSAGCQGEG